MEVEKRLILSTELQSPPQWNLLKETKEWNLLKETKEEWDEAAREEGGNQWWCSSPRPRLEFSIERGELCSVLLRGIIIAAKVLGGQDVWFQECDAWNWMCIGFQLLVIWGKTI